MDTTWHTRPPSRATRAHVAPRWPGGGAEEAQTRGRGHASPCGGPGGATWQVRGLEVDGPMG